VATMQDMTDYRTVTDAKAHLNEIVEAVQAAGERVVITRKGLPAALLMSLAEYESLLETLDVLSDPTARGEILAAEGRIDAGHYFTADDIRREFLDKKG
jgi:antitoxin YefM